MNIRRIINKHRTLDETDFSKLKNSLKLKAERFARRIEPVYKSLDWHWIGHSGYEIPSRKEIKENIISLINDLRYHPDKGEWLVETGGIRVGYKKSNNHEIAGYIMFSVSETIWRET